MPLVPLGRSPTIFLEIAHVPCAFGRNKYAIEALRSGAFGIIDALREPVAGRRTTIANWFYAFADYDTRAAPNAAASE
jgi:hypothetical protein